MNFIVIKCGGSVFSELPDSFYKQVVQLQQSGNWLPLIIHGGGPSISAMLDKLDVTSNFVNGLRVTTSAVLDTAEMVLSGQLNKALVRKIKQAGGTAIGLSGVDADLLQVSPVADHKTLGYVGEVKQVNKTLLRQLTNQNLIPIVSPIGVDEAGQHYNVNADLAAGAIAGALRATLCFVSDIPGIYVPDGGGRQVLSLATKAKIEQLIAEEVITGGMIPKVEAALSALALDVPRAVIMDGKDPEALLAFSRGEKIGTQIVLEEEVVHG